jgi:leishmanolysin
VAPRHLTAEAETLLSATLIHEVMHVLGFDPHAFTHFRDERKRRRSQVPNNVFPICIVPINQFLLFMTK